MKRLIWVLPILATGVLAVGCPAFPGACDYGGCLDGGVEGSVLPDGTVNPESSTDAKPDADPIPTDCTTPTDPVKNPEKCLVDSFGAFVSPTGNDGDAGTKAKPFKTIAKALGTTRTRIVVCEGEYAGSLEVARGVEIFSGVTCDFSKAGGKAKIVASKPAYGVKVAKVSDAVILADLEIVGMNAVAPSESSVGVFVSESANVKIARSKIEAGDGADAPPKKDGAFVMPADAALKGANADDKGTGAPGDDTAGVGGDTGTCPGGGFSRGGAGGISGVQGVDGAPRPPGGAKGAIAGCGAGGTGLDGDLGTVGASRAGAQNPGTMTSVGYVGTTGQDGENGSPAGGGGGGFGSAGAGGGGGAGGCGGQGGKAGTSGGSSLAVVSFTSTVGLEAVELVAKAAKVGGAGGAGQTGQGGGFRGNGSGGACSGGNGAKGGDGGGGGGGAGGIAVGIAWAGGKEPTRDASTKITRPTGAAPLGGEGGAGATNKGVDGVHADVFEVK